MDEWRVHFNVDFQHTLFVGLFATIVWTDHTHLCGNITNFYGAYYLPICPLIAGSQNPASINACSPTIWPCVKCMHDLRRTGYVLLKDMHITYVLCSEISIYVGSYFPLSDGDTTDIINQYIILLQTPCSYELLIHGHIFEHFLWKEHNDSIAINLMNWQKKLESSYFVLYNSCKNRWLTISKRLHCKYTNNMQMKLISYSGDSVLSNS